MLDARIAQFLTHPLAWLEPPYLRWTRMPPSSAALGVALDLTRSRPGLLLENAPLRPLLIILPRQIKKPRLTRRDRLSLLLLASRLRSWKQALVILKPDTLLHWHRQGFRLFWRLKSRARPRRSPSQDWNTFLKNHAKEVWACDFVPVIDLFFRTVYVFFIIELDSRRVLHFGVTRHPADAWVAQQLREATPYVQAPRFLIRDNDCKFGSEFTSTAKASGIEILRTPYRAPRANAICERFIASVRRECLDHTLILGDGQLYQVIKEYVALFNGARPHPGIDQQIPERRGTTEEEKREGKIISFPILNGLHHDYRRAA